MPLNGQEYLQKKRATSARKSASALARYNRPPNTGIISTPQQLPPQKSIYQTSQHESSIAPELSPTRSRLPRKMLMEISNNAFLAQANPHPWKKQTSEPWKRLPNSLLPSEPTHSTVLNPQIPSDLTRLQDDVFGPPASSTQSSTTLSQLHRAFKIGPIPPPPPQYQSSNSTTLSQVQRRFGIERQPAVTPFHMDVESPSPTTVYAAA